MIEQILDELSAKLNLRKNEIKIYKKSQVLVLGDEILMLKINGVKRIAVMGNGAAFCEFHGDSITPNLKLCPLTHLNRLVINKFLEYTVPKSFGRKQGTFGVGDRLGLATPGHIRIISNSNVKPILAQQSKRELDLTGRTFSKVLDDVTFSVFQEGYKDGFGADGDHLKHGTDISEAIESGYTMITLDCSEKIGFDLESKSSDELIELYKSLPSHLIKGCEEKYLNKPFKFNKSIVAFNKDELVRCVLIYYNAVLYIEHIYKEYILKASRFIDFEVSIDETSYPTTSFAHTFVAQELADLGVNITSLAPRFIGEFQKGIDYIGNLDEFEKQLEIHAAIANSYGYKLSIHSGSDKFSIFPIIGKYLGNKLHIKTSGTNWLEAVALIAEKNPDLYREIHKTALIHFNEAKAFYHVSADLSKVPDLSTVDDAHLLNYFSNDNSRQLIHITYGFILRDESLKIELYETLNSQEEFYFSRLEKHIGKHLSMVGLIA
jgi:tagaturonate epimerase